MGWMDGWVDGIKQEMIPSRHRTIHSRRAVSVCASVMRRCVMQQARHCCLLAVPACVASYNGAQLG